MTLLDYYLIASIVLLVAFGILFRFGGPGSPVTILGKVIINLTAVTGAVILAGRLGLLGLVI